MWPYLLGSGSNLKILAKEVIDRIFLPINFDENSSSKMLASISFGEEEWCSGLVNHQKITRQDVEKFIFGSTENVPVFLIQKDGFDKPLIMSFGLIIKVDGLYYSISNNVCVVNGKCEFFMTSQANKIVSKDKFERWSGMIYENRKPQTDEDGNFI